MEVEYAMIQLIWNLLSEEHVFLFGVLHIAHISHNFLRQLNVSNYHGKVYFLDVTLKF